MALPDQIVYFHNGGLWVFVSVLTRKSMYADRTQRENESNQASHSTSGPQPLPPMLLFDRFAEVQQLQVSAHLLCRLVSLARGCGAGFEEDGVEFEQAGVVGTRGDIGGQGREFLAVF